MNIRELAPPDAAAFQSLRLQALAECPSAFASSHAEECELPGELVAERIAPRPDRCVLGAFIGPQLVGMVGLQREEMRKLSHKAFIWGMYVAQNGRRSGIGRALVYQALVRAEHMSGVCLVNLGVNAANSAAIALYEGLGFVAFGLERGFMLLDGQFHDEIHMARLFPAT